jgi:serine/threonine protein kinase
MTIATHTVGTWQWLAPEMMEPGSQYGTTVDVYGLGIIMWELLSGQVPPTLSRTLVVRLCLTIGCLGCAALSCRTPAKAL